MKREPAFTRYWFCAGGIPPVHELIEKDRVFVVIPNLVSGNDRA
jgi:hypothetical protein